MTLIHFLNKENFLPMTLAYKSFMTQNLIEPVIPKSLSNFLPTPF